MLVYLGADYWFMTIAYHNSCGVAKGKAKEMAATGVARINTEKTCDCQSIRKPNINQPCMAATCVAWEMWRGNQTTPY